MGAHILAIKDMAGLCKPAAAKLLVATLKQEVGIPIHFHTHDTAGIQQASLLNAAGEGLEIADGAFASMSGGTSQVNLNTLVESIRYSPRESKLQTDALLRYPSIGKPFDSFTRLSKANLSRRAAIFINMKCLVVNTRTFINRPRR